MTPLRALALVLAALGLAGCTGGTPASRPTIPTTTATVPSPTPDVPYHYSDLDLCKAIDVAPLAALGLVVGERRRKPPLGYRKGQAEMCLHEMKARSGHIARLTVTAIPAASVDKARRTYQATEQGSMKPDGVVPGPWEQGAARTLDTIEGDKQSQYLMHILDGNLHIEVWLAVDGAEYTRKEDLRPVVKAITDEAYTVVTRAWA